MNRVVDNQPPYKCRNSHNPRYRKSARVGQSNYKYNDQTRKPESYYTRVGKVTALSKPTDFFDPEVDWEHFRKGEFDSKLSRADNRIMKVIRFLLARHIHFIVLALAVVYLGYSWFSVQTKYAQTKGYDFDGVVKLAYGNTLVNFYRDAGHNRPLITTTEGDPLLEISDWASSISVNGVSRNLWDTYHSYDLDSKRNRFYQAMTYGSWTLFKEITAGPEPNRVQVEYYFRTSEQLDEVRLQLGHFNYHFVEPHLGNLGFESYLSAKNIPEEEQARNIRYKLALQVNLAAFQGGVAPVKITEGSKDKYGLTSINSTYTYNNLPVNERILLASEEFTWESATGPKAAK